jgi:hypothetical protein
MGSDNPLDRHPLPLANAQSGLGRHGRVWAIRRWSWMDVGSDLVRNDA